MKKRINFENYWGKKLKENSSPTDNSWQTVKSQRNNCFSSIEVLKRNKNSCPSFISLAVKMNQFRSFKIVKLSE